MIALVVLITTLVTASIFAFVFRSRLPRAHIAISLPALAAAVGGILLVISSSNEIIIARLTKSWPVVQGVVTKSEVIGKRAVRPLVFYQYSFAGTLYADSSSLGIPSFGNRRVRINESETIVAEYKPGDSVTVHVDPEQPSHSTLYAREDWSSYMRLTVGDILFGLGVFFGLLALWPRRS